MTSRVLLTGGAGFIGSHVADELLARGYRVRALDNLVTQVHPERRRPSYLDPEVELIEGDVRDRDAVVRALRGVDRVVHLAALVGVGQSMYRVADYMDTNTRGTAVLLEALIERPVERLVVASSMSIYGEGRYHGPDGEIHDAVERTPEQLASGRWDPTDARGRTLRPLPTPEHKPPRLSSVYALSKYDQERLCLLLGRAYRIPTVALRFFNVYGPRQALANPYTGVLAIFASRYLADRPPLIFEDGQQRRDFVSVHDVARACLLALERDGVADRVFNVASGQAHSVVEIATALARVLGKQDIAPQLTGELRVGDIRHCFAAIDEAERLLGYRPQVSLDQGLAELAEWLREQSSGPDRVDAARDELARRGLTFGAALAS